MGLPLSMVGCFNTQPPEGGWASGHLIATDQLKFQHTAARRRLAVTDDGRVSREEFQHTAARRRLG